MGTVGKWSDLREMLIDILQHHETPGKIRINLHLDYNNVSIMIDDLDQEWFDELMNFKKGG